MFEKVDQLLTFVAVIVNLLSWAFSACRISNYQKSVVISAFPARACEFLLSGLSSVLRSHL